MSRKSSQDAESTAPKAYNWNRAATISSASPLKFNRNISTATREKFQALDLEILLAEFRNVADNAGDAVDDDDEATVDGQSEENWLDGAGMTKLTEKIRAGKPITQEDIERETEGLTSLQVQAVAQRAETLNQTIRAGSKQKKVDARQVFPGAGRPVSTTSDLDPESIQQLTALTDDVEEPPTKFQHLSVEDQNQVQCLNLIQLTSILEQQKQPFDMRPSERKKKKKDKKSVPTTFGTSLASVSARDQEIYKDLEYGCVPLVFSRIVDFLKKKGVEEEGIFRKAGAAARIKQLRQTIEDAKGDIDLEAIGARTHDVSALLKQFLRDLPEPLLTTKYIETFSATQNLDSPELQIYALKLLVMLLPPVNRACLKILMDFLSYVASKHSVNKMGVSNLAVVFAPTLFYVRGQKGQKMLKEVEMQVSTASTLKLLLEQNNDLWNVPPDIIAQIRFVNESKKNKKGRKSSSTKEVKRILSKGKGSRPSTDLSGVTENVKWIIDNATEAKAIVKITTSSSPKEATITRSTTVAEVIETIGAAKGATLREVGGNIGSRLLDRRTKIMSVVRVNPRLSLVVEKC